MDNVIIYDKLDELNEGIEYNGGGITSLLGKGCIKSVQRGVLNSQAFSGGQTFSIPISQIDAEKGVLISEVNGRGNTSGNFPFTSISLSGNTIILKNEDTRYNSTITCSWQVVEFY